MRTVKMDDIKKDVEKVVADSGVKYSNEDILLLIGCCEQFKSRGYSFTHVEVAEFLVSKKNLEMIEEIGITKTIYAMSKMRLGTIKKSKSPGRNDPCKCGKMKYKKCNPTNCLNGQG